MPRNKSEKVVEHIYQTDVLTLLHYATDIKDGRLVGLVGKGLYSLNNEQEAAEDAIGDRQCAIERQDADFFDRMADGLPFNEARNLMADLIIERHKAMVMTLMHWGYTTETSDGYARLNAALASMNREHQNIFTAWPHSTKRRLGNRLLAYARAVARDSTDAIFPIPLL